MASSERSLNGSPLQQRIIDDRQLRALEVQWMTAREARRVALIDSDIHQPPSAAFWQADSAVNSLSETLTSRYVTMNQQTASWLAGLNGTSGDLLVTSTAYAIFLSRLRFNLGPALDTWRAWAPGGSTYGNRPIETDCEDPLRNELVVNLLSALENGNQAAYSAYLVRIGQSLRCFSIDDAEAFGVGIVEAIDTTIRVLPTSVQAEGKAALLNGLLNLVVIVYDETKVIGLSILRDWMKVNLRSLKELSAWPDSVTRRTGFWISTADGDHYVQLRNFCEDASSQSTNLCFSLGHALEALVNPWRLGTGVCHLSEMLTPRFDPGVGYICQREICNLRSPGPVPSTASQLASTTGKTQFGVDVSQLQNSTCGSTGRTGGWDSFGGGDPGTGGALPPSTVGCIAKDSRPFMAEQFACVMSAAQSTKTTRTLKGGRAGPGCNPAAAGPQWGTVKDVKNTMTDQTKDLIAKGETFGKFNLTSDKDRWIERFASYGWQVSSKEFDQTVDKIGTEKYVSDSDYLKLTKGSDCAKQEACTIYDSKTKEFQVVVNADKIRASVMSSSQLGRILSHEFVHKMTMTKKNELKGMDPQSQHDTILYNCLPSTSDCVPPPVCQGSKQDPAERDPFLG